MNEEIEKLLNREHLQLASIKKRAVAFFIDEMLLSFLLIIAMSDSFSKAQTVEDIIILTNTYVMQYIIMKIVYQTFFVMQYGATLGKLAMKIRVIDIRTLDNPNFAISLNRAVFRIISEMIFYLGFLWGMFDPQRQTWHDKTAKTLVIDA
ncbi:RDD family protein [Sulfurimonas autotrophica]|uniref:RDD domain containing protein n=1 Tax=Sulfurimonas autotrophica (strain ATCC BAA-671 / DSM 16294 / JCM 11897 / OK10) TaxID=563040 RepID=E0UQ84_SULAO|nr:RDD family protein [Sulfurimonas autotrophica]ADN09827.1 RDD domain containing protein [Sulfurimonas autotrophica DSM 16294]